MLYLGDCLEVLPTIKYKVDLAYADVPYNTGHAQVSTRDKGLSYEDSFEDLPTYLKPRIELVYDLLGNSGALLLHLDYREVHYVKVMLDGIFGRSNFRNEIIWAYDYGGRPKNKWPCKHDNILWYTKSNNYTFNYEEIDRIPYMSPLLVGPEKTKAMKTMTDVHWHTIVPTQGKERTGYPTQKPVGLLKNLVRVHSNPEDMLLDPFCGASSFGAAALELGREYIGIDINHQAIEISTERLNRFSK